MMRAIATGLLLCICAVCFAADESRQPSLEYYLEIDGKTHKLELGKQIQIDGTYKNPQVRLRASTIRTFSCSGLTFMYPASFGWEADIEDARSKQWVLSGNDFKIMYFVQADKLSLESYVSSMVRQWGREKTRVSKAERAFGGKKHQGKHIMARISGVVLNTEVYALPSANGSRFLMLQDCPPDNGLVSLEAKRALALLSKTMKDTWATPRKPKANDGR